MDLEFIEKLSGSNVPYSGSLELTHRRNLACRHCYQFPPGSRPELSTGQWMEVMRDLAAAGCLFLAFTGGEPLLREDLPQLVREAAAMGYVLTLQTNAVLLDSAMAGMLGGLPTVRVDISLYAAGPATNDHFTSMDGSFAAAVRAIEMLRGNGVPVLLKVTVGSYNIDELEGIAALADSLGVKAVFSSLIFPCNDRDMAPTALRLDDEGLERFMRFDADYKLKKLGEILGSDAEGLTREDLTGYLGECAVDPAQVQGGKRRPCGAGRNSFAVNPYGDVYPCVAFPLVLGNVLRHNMTKIWRRSPELVYLRGQGERLPEECAHCALLEKCGICMALSYLEEGEMMAVSRERCRHTNAMVKVLEHEGYRSR